MNSRRAAGSRNMNLHASAAPAPKYDILVSILNPRPDQQNVHWNVQAAIDGSYRVSIHFSMRTFKNKSKLISAYIRPFIDQLSMLSNYDLKSQWKYQVPLEFTNKQVSSSSFAPQLWLFISDLG